MVRERKMSNPKTIPIQVEKETYEAIMSNTPRDISFADLVRQWMHNYLESIEMEKNGHPNSDPLNLNQGKMMMPDAFTDNDNIHLDLYKDSEIELVQKVYQLAKIGDWHTLKMISPKAGAIHKNCVKEIIKKNDWTPEKAEMLRNFKQKRQPSEYRVPMGLD